MGLWLALMTAGGAWAAPARVPEGVGLAGLWVDPRTGVDFLLAKRAGDGLELTLYGDGLERPRYLTQGKARPAGSEGFLAEVSDQPGQCCGNQGRLRLRLLDDGRLELAARWWPQGGNDPGPGYDPPFTLERVAAAPAPPAPAPPGQAPSAPAVSPVPPPEAPCRGLWRLWHPGQLMHAYASDPGQLEELKRRGFHPEGEIGRLAEQGGPGTVPLSAPAGQPLGGGQVLGHPWNNAAPDTTALWELRARLADPLRGHPREDLLLTSRPETVAAAQEAGYGKPRLLGFVRPEDEPAYLPPLLYDWTGSWQGEGWGRFFLTVEGDRLFLLWYYGRRDTPHYFGRYRLAPDRRSAEGQAFGPLGGQATHFRHRLEFVLDAPEGPAIRVTAWRLAAPLDDGQLVVFRQPAAKEITLVKQAQAIAAEEAEALQRATGDPARDPAKVLATAIQAARRAGRLQER